MQLLVFISSDADVVSQIICKAMDMGLSGFTTVDCEGAFQAISHSNIEPPPSFGSLRQFFNKGNQHGKIMISVMPEEKIAVAKELINDVTGGLDKSNTGVVFTVDLSSAEGMKKE